jgi:aspartate ammonia-lyase
LHSPALTTALVPHIGYNRASELAKLMKENKYDIFEANTILKSIDDARLKEIIQPGNLLKLGFSLEDIK